MTFTVRYVIDEGPIERFLTFIPIEAHGAEYLANIVINFLKDNNIPINDCRGQSYDNAANMSGQYSGLQARFKKCNKYAEYIPCSGHSLNLVGIKAAECNLNVTAFFSYVQKLFVFFSASTHRWQKLVTALGTKKKVLKSLSETRWSARIDAVGAVHDGHPEVSIALDEIAKDVMQTNDTRFEALCLQEKHHEFDNIFLMIVWNDVLSKIHATNFVAKRKN